MSRILLLSLSLLLAAGCAADDAPDGAAEAPRRAEQAPQVGADAGKPAEGPSKTAEEAPKFPVLEVDTLDHGRFVLAEQRGKWVVVNYWATWCAPCLKEIPELTEFDAAREDVQVIGLAFEEIELDDMREFLTRRPAGYPIALVDVYAPPADFEVPRGLPMTWLIAPDGSIARRFLGPVTAESLGEAIAAHGQ